LSAPPEIPCDEAVRRVYEFLDSELDATWQERVRRHLEVCRRCYPLFNFERAFLEHIRSRGHPVERSEELVTRIRAALDETG